IDFIGMDETDFESSILQNLRASDAVLVIVTEHTFEDRIHEEDDWVRREIREALTLNKPIIMALVDGLLPPENLPDDIRAIQGKEGIRFFPEFFDAGVQKLADFIVKVTPIQRRPVSAPMSMKSGISFRTFLRSHRLLVIAGFIGIAVILGIV